MRDGRAIAAALGGKRVSKGWRFKCPCHDDRRPSCGIMDSGHITCFAGCKTADVAAALDKLGFTDNGVAPRRRTRVEIEADRSTHVAYAQKLWNECDDTPYNKTVVASYLKHRGITLPVPSCIRRWQNGWIARITNLTGEITAVQHRLPMQHPITEGWMSSGEAIQLVPCLGEDLALAEGVETGLSFIQKYHIACWVTCGAKRLPFIRIPRRVRSLYILQEHDQTGQECSQRALERYLSINQGLNVQLVPTSNERWKDFNDILKEETNAER